MNTIKLTKANFNEVINGNATVLVDFWAAWCGPCRMLSPVIDEVASENASFVVGKVNVDEEPELAEKFGIMTIPTLIAFKNGVPTTKSSGVAPKASILNLVK